MLPEPVLLTSWGQEHLWLANEVPYPKKETFQFFGRKADSKNYYLLREIMRKYYD